MKLFRKQSNKYILMINKLNLSKSRNIEDSLCSLLELKRELNSYDYRKLVIMRTEINAIHEDYKQNSLVATVISTAASMFILIFNMFKDAKTMNPGIQSYVIIFVLLVFMLAVLGYSRSAQSLNQLISIVDLVIKEKDEINKIHEEAYVEHSKRICI